MSYSGMEHKESTTYEKNNCKRCGKFLPKNWDGDYCDTCKEAILFDQVRDFIRDNNVTEREVAEYFGIPRAKVKEWIQDGRVQYTSTRNKLL